MLTVDKGFAETQNGNIAILAALLLPVLIFAFAGGVDFTNRARVQRTLQEAADAGALAAAFAVVHKEDVSLKAGQAAHRVFCRTQSLISWRRATNGSSQKFRAAMNTRSPPSWRRPF